MTVYIVMGVSGCGKSTVGKAIADALGIPFHDADDFHSARNVAKMSAGEPLTDSDRAPWLKTVAITIELLNRDRGGVFACSALKQMYRDSLTSYSDDYQFIYLKGSRDVIAERLKARQNHYMNPDLLDSQFEILEEPIDAITVEIDRPVEEIVSTALAQIGQPATH